MPTSKLPEVKHVYQNHHLDSTRWEVYQPRAGDIIVTTSYKSGTTWTQQILHEMLHGHEDKKPEMREISPWVDARFMGTTKKQMRDLLAGLSSPRFLKSHLPLDGLPYHPEARYLIVARDTRDVFMSLLNHYSSYTDIAMGALNSPDRPGDPFPRCPEDAREVWRAWMTRGWFPWESEGWPMWSNLHHTQTYWEYRHLPNFLFLHYNDMLADLEGAVRRIAGFTRIPIDDAAVARIVENTTFANVRKKIDEAPEEEDTSRLFFEGGQKRFFFKGKNERWRGVLTEADLALYEEAKQRVLSPDCAAWLENGGPVV